MPPMDFCLSLIHHAAAVVYVETFPTPSLECAVEDADGEPIGGANLGEPRDACDFLHLDLVHQQLEVSVLQLL
eukprot:12887384-Prorocentrum_lima.AAC.1